MRLRARGRASYFLSIAPESQRLSARVAAKPRSRSLNFGLCALDIHIIQPCLFTSMNVRNVIPGLKFFRRRATSPQRSVRSVVANWSEWYRLQRFSLKVPAGTLPTTPQRQRKARRPNPNLQLKRKPRKRQKRAPQLRKLQTRLHPPSEQATEGRVSLEQWVS
jgi:hypothetical protein